MAIVVEHKTIGGMPMTYTRSDSGHRIVRDGVTYDEAWDPEDSGRVYEESDEYIATTGVNPAVVYRKSYLAQWLYGAGLYDMLKGIIAMNPEAQMYWETSTEFDADHPQWPAILEGIQQGLGLTDSQVESLLYYGEHGVGAASAE